ncbi:hypothetical protein [Patulibacter sp.]|uniref:hypothetical protein n=1 Tax=Patulibacter sp. TaxID=1912859 RepID=UPI002716FD52|nr:hypothetical protein [Patulibacter sp.]MDO9410674.1 hypothetical protein [Patulibacter sp.]
MTDQRATGWLRRILDALGGAVAGDAADARGGARTRAAPVGGDDPERREDPTSQVLTADGGELDELLRRSAGRGGEVAPDEAAALRSSVRASGLVVLHLRREGPLVLRDEDLPDDAVAVVAWLPDGAESSAGGPPGADRPGGSEAPAVALLQLTAAEIRGLRTARVPIAVAQALWEAGSARLDED